MNRRKAVQEETSLIAMRVFEKLLETTDEDSQSKQVATDEFNGSRASIQSESEQQSSVLDRQMQGTG